MAWRVDKSLSEGFLHCRSATENEWDMDRTGREKPPIKHHDNSLGCFLSSRRYEPGFSDDRVRNLWVGRTDIHQNNGSGDKDAFLTFTINWALKLLACSACLVWVGLPMGNVAPRDVFALYFPNWWTDGVIPQEQLLFAPEKWRKAVEKRCVITTLT